MRRIFENIEDIYIIGGPEELSKIVSEMDISLQKISQNFENMYEALYRYVNINSGLQLQQLINTTIELRENLYDFSIDLNTMQNNLVEYQRKILRFEGLPESTMLPNHYYVEMKELVSVDTTKTTYDITELNYLIKDLEGWYEEIDDCLRSIVQDKNDIGTIWKDSQYNVFSDFIDEVSNETDKGMNVFGEYIVYLKNRIKELQ